MSQQRIQHDAAFAAAMHLTEIASGLLRDEERKDFFDEAFQVVMAAIEGYQVQINREVQRLNPSHN